MTTQSWFQACAVACAAGLTWAANTQPTEGQTGARPQYSADGTTLQLPAGFETWVFVGSNLGMAYDKSLPLTDAREAARAAGPQFFHNVYISPEAYAHYAATGQFPDPTILVMEVFLPADKDTKGVLASGVFNGTRRGVEVAVKDTRRPRDHVPGPPSNSAWAYYVFMDPFDDQAVLQSAVRAERPGRCQNCHEQHSGPDDHVWVQFYPTLRKVKK